MRSVMGWLRNVKYYVALGRMPIPTTDSCVTGH
jgi:hypothetical protein